MPLPDWDVNPGKQDLDRDARPVYHGTMKSETTTPKPVGVQYAASELLTGAAPLRVAVAVYCARNRRTQNDIEEELGLARGSLSAILGRDRTTPTADRVRELVGYEESSRNLTAGG